jgi:protein gp37
MHPDWARSLRDQCAAARVPFFFKQNGEFLHNGEPSDWCRQTFNRVGKKAAGRLLDGREWNDYPEVR